MRSTLLTAKNSRISETIGVCKDSDDFKSYLNEAQSRLVSRGDWKGSWQPIRICVSDSCLTLPREVIALREIALCGEPINIRNAWFEYLQNGPGISRGCSCPGPNFEDRGFRPTIADIKPPNKRVRAYITNTADVGKKLHVFGYDSNGVWIQSSVGGVMIDGFYLTLADPFVDSTFDIQSVTGVQKDTTQSPVPFYEVDTQSGAQRLLANYQPTELVPSYHRYFMSGINSGNCTCKTAKTIDAIAKLDFIPVENDWDYLYIDNIPALKDMCQSIRLGEMDSPQAQAQSLFFEKKAVRELNHEKENIADDDTIAVGMRVFGSAPLRNRNIGRLT